MTKNERLIADSQRVIMEVMASICTNQGYTDSAAKLQKQIDEIKRELAPPLRAVSNECDLTKGEWKC